MEGPADTVIYMIAGYGVIFTILIAYLVSLVVRWRNLRQDQEILEQVEEGNEVKDSHAERRQASSL